MREVAGILLIHPEGGGRGGEEWIVRSTPSCALLPWDGARNDSSAARATRAPAASAAPQPAGVSGEGGLKYATILRRPGKAPSAYGLVVVVLGFSASRTEDAANTAGGEFVDLDPDKR